MARPSIWVGMNPVSFVLMHDGLKVCDMTFDDIVACLGHFTRMFSVMERHNDPVHEFNIRGTKITGLTYIDIIELNMQFTSCLRYEVVK